MVASQSPTVLKRYVALELKRLRLNAGFGREQVAERLRRKLSHVTRIEITDYLPSAAEVEVLLDFYGVPERTSAFLDLVDAARNRKDWFAPFKGSSPPWFNLYLGMETSAAVIESFDSMSVPGIFQTPAYADAVIRGGEPDLPDHEVHQRIELRMARQDVLTRPAPPQVWCVLDESVLYRRAENPAVLPEQLEHVLKLEALPNVHIQVLPRDGIGLHAGIEGTFTVLTFPPELEGDPGVVYTESRIRGEYHEDAAEIMRYRDTWNRLKLLATNAEQSRTIIRRRLKEITK